MATDSKTKLGVELKRELIFTLHINELCTQTGKKINALKRLKGYLGEECKLIIHVQ